MLFIAVQLYLSCTLNLVQCLGKASSSGAGYEDTVCFLISVNDFFSMFSCLTFTCIVTYHFMMV